MKQQSLKKPPSLKTQTAKATVQTAKATVQPAKATTQTVMITQRQQRLNQEADKGAAEKAAAEKARLAKLEQERVAAEKAAAEKAAAAVAAQQTLHVAGRKQNAAVEAHMTPELILAWNYAEHLRPDHLVIGMTLENFILDTLSRRNPTQTPLERLDLMQKFDYQQREAA